MKHWLRFLDGEFRAAHLTLRVLAIGSLLVIVARWMGLPIPHFVVVFGWFALGLKTLVKLAELLTLWLRRGTTYERKLSQVSPLMAIGHTELRIYRWFLASWKKTTPVDGGFSFRRGPIYDSLVYVLWISFLLEIPFMLLLTHLVPWLKPYAFIADACAALLAVYVLVIFKADRFAVRQTSHQILDEGLVIAMGMRVDGLIALRDVVAVSAVPARTWNDRVKAMRLAGESFAKVSPLDKPNVALDVAENGATLTWMHGRTTTPRHIGLYVDEPARFIAAIEEARAHLGASDADVRTTN